MHLMTLSVIDPHVLAISEFLPPRVHPFKSLPQCIKEPTNEICTQNTHKRSGNSLSIRRLKPWIQSSIGLDVQNATWLLLLPVEPGSVTNKAQSPSPVFQASQEPDRRTKMQGLDIEQVGPSRSVQLSTSHSIACRIDQGTECGLRK